MADNQIWPNRKILIDIIQNLPFPHKGVVRWFRWRRLLSRSCWVRPGAAPAMRRAIASDRKTRGTASYRYQSQVRQSSNEEDLNSQRACTHRHQLRESSQTAHVSLEAFEDGGRHGNGPVRFRVLLLALFPQRSAGLEQPVNHEQLHKL